jgi:hypothetical protein
VNKLQNSCPLTQQQLIETHFMEMRAKVLDLAAFLDRMDRSCKADAENDFRILALRKALQRLSASTTWRAYDIQMILSDPTTELLDHLDRKNAFGAFHGQKVGEPQ